MAFCIKKKGETYAGCKDKLINYEDALVPSRKFGRDEYVKDHLLGLSPREDVGAKPDRWSYCRRLKNQKNNVSNT